MSADPIDSVVDDAESESNPKSRGARNRYFFLAAIVGDKGEKKRIVYEAISSDVAADAKEIFKEKYGVSPSVCDEGKGNGYYVAMGTGMSEAQRISVTVTPKQLMQRTTNLYKGQFRGWNVWASGLSACSVEDENFKDNELVSVEFDTLVDPENKIPKPKLKKREVVRLSDLQNVESV